MGLLLLTSQSTLLLKRSCWRIRRGQRSMCDAPFSQQSYLLPKSAHLTLKGSHNVHAAGTTVCHPVLWLTAFQIAEGTTEAAPDCVMKLWNSLNNSGYSWGTACGSKNTTTPLWPVIFNIMNPPSFLTFHADSSLPTLTPCTILLKSTKTSVSLCLLNAQSFKV